MNGLPECAGCSLPVHREGCARPRPLSGEPGEWPRDCPTAGEWHHRLESLSGILDDPDALEAALAAGEQEAAGYVPGSSGEPPRPVKTRLEEIAEYADRLGIERLGLAFCVGLAREAAVCRWFFESRGFEVASVCCKVGAVSKEALGLDSDTRIVPGRDESMCNPSLQALTLNRAGTGLNVILGLCVGHDSVFFRESEAPCTVLACKDRVTGHNPMAAVYTLESYYRCLAR